MSKKIKALQTLGLIAGTTVAIGSLGVAGYAIADGAITLPTQAETPTVTPPQDVSTVVTDTAITVSPVENAEYSLDGKTWQDSNIFLGLQPAQEEDTPASEITTVQVTTNKAAQAVPQINAPETTADSIIFEQIAGLEFSINNGETWQSENIFASLSPATEYTVLVRYAETATHYASDTVSFQITTPKYEQSMPTEQTNSNYCEPTSITVGAIEGAEYSIDGIHYQDSNVFENLEVNTEYLFYIRYKETATHYASEPYTVYISTIKYSQSIPEISDAESTSPTSITMPVFAGVEYSIDGTQYSSNNVFTDLQPNTWYNIYARYAETATHYAGEPVLISIQTPKYQQDAPVISLVEATTNSITVTELENCEYSINNGDTWQDSNVFTDLKDNTQYTILARYKETATHYASDNYQLSVKTEIQKQTQTLSQEIINSIKLKSSDTNYIELTPAQAEGVEYAIAQLNQIDNLLTYPDSIPDTDWKDIPRFENLTSNEYFVVYFRLAETDTLLESDAQYYGGGGSYKDTLKTTPQEVVDDVIYSISNNEANVSGYIGTTVKTSLSIQSSISHNSNTYQVTSLQRLKSRDWLSIPNTIILPTTITNISSSFFSELSMIEKIYLNSNLTTDLKLKADIGNQYAGSSSKNVTIYIGENVTQIPNILGGKYVTTIVFETETPPTLSATNFDSCEILNAIYVPDNSLDTYKTNENLLSYADKIKPLSEYVAE